MIGDVQEVRVDWTLNAVWRLVKILKKKGYIEVRTMINHLEIREKKKPDQPNNIIRMWSTGKIEIPT